MTIEAAEAAIAEILAGLEGVTEGPWQVIEARHPWVLLADEAHPEAMSGEHIERQIATVANHPQSHAPCQVVCLAIGRGVDKPVYFVAIDETDAAHIARCDPATIRTLAEGFAALKAEREMLAKEVERCHVRLEIDHHFVLANDEEMLRVDIAMEERLNEIDGIEARDCTIAIQDESIAKLKGARLASEAECERLREALSNLADEMQFMLVANPKKDGGLYRRRLNEALAALEGKAHA